MDNINIPKEEFLKLSTNEIAQITSELGKPKVGVFVPDGNRRMTLAFSGLHPDTDEFYHENARQTTTYFMDNLKVFFSHGLKTLFVPLISHNILERNQKYHEITLYEGLKKILIDEDWLNFHKENDIRVSTYGDINQLSKSAGTFNSEWIEKARNATAHHNTHKIFYGFLSPKRVGMELAPLGIEFYNKNEREPSYEEQILMYYGEPIDPADFFIMSTKFAGLGALPPLICGQETQLYFFAAPGVMALTQETYREILYDLLFCRPNSANNEYTNLDTKDIESLKNYYLNHQSAVIGIGRRIGKFWTPEI
jgi:hypothetical protein